MTLGEAVVGGALLGAGLFALFFALVERRRAAAAEVELRQWVRYCAKLQDDLAFWNENEVDDEPECSVRRAHRGGAGRRG